MRISMSLRSMTPLASFAHAQKEHLTFLVMGKSAITRQSADVGHTDRK